MKIKSIFIITILNFTLLNSLFAQEVTEEDEVIIYEVAAPRNLSGDYANDSEKRKKLKELEAIMADDTNKENNAANALSASCYAIDLEENEKAWKYIEIALEKGFCDKKRLNRISSSAFSLATEDKWVNAFYKIEKNTQRLSSALRGVWFDELIPFYSNDKVGLMNKGYKEVASPAIFDTCYKVKDEVFFYYQGQKIRHTPYGIEILDETRDYYKHDNKPVAVEDVVSSDDVFKPTPTKNGKGFDEKFGTIISYSKDYKELTQVDFNNNIYALVKQNELWGIVDKKGKAPFSALDIKSKYINITKSKGFLLEDTKGKLSFISAEGKTVVKDAMAIESLDNGRLAIKQTDKWGIIDEKGKVIIAAQYQNFLGSKIQGKTDKFQLYQMSDGVSHWFYVDEDSIEYKKY
jgi:hypothetical protein